MVCGLDHSGSQPFIYTICNRKAESLKLLMLSYIRACIFLYVSMYVHVQAYEQNIHQHML